MFVSRTVGYYCMFWYNKLIYKLCQFSRNLGCSQHKLQICINMNQTMEMLQMFLLTEESKFCVSGTNADVNIQAGTQLITTYYTSINGKLHKRKEYPAL